VRVGGRGASRGVRLGDVVARAGCADEGRQCGRELVHRGGQPTIGRGRGRWGRRQQRGGKPSRSVRHLCVGVCVWFSGGYGSCFKPSSGCGF
jgi:hypothetical protein